MKNIFIKKIQLATLFWGISSMVYAQNTKAEDIAKSQEFNTIFLWIYLGFIGILVIVTAVIALRTLKLYQGMLLKAIAKEQGRTPINAEIEKTFELKETWASKMWYQLVGTGGQTIEQNEDIQINHPHDGIYELDNGMPPWLRNVFVVTIVFAITYLWYFHAYQKGEKGMHYEYKVAMKEGEIQKLLASEKQENSVSENNVVASKDAHELDEGKSVFIAKCAVCHGQKGEGGVGPNMTDDYWIHGGDIKKVFSTIKYGVPDKGMISWKDQLKPKEIAEVASYILTLKGTNPPNPKAPQGEIYKGEATPASDTTKSKI